MQISEATMEGDGTMNLAPIIWEENVVNLENKEFLWKL